MMHHFIDRSIVRNHESLEVPLFLENILKQISIACCRDTVILIESRHHTQGAGIHTSLVWWQINIPKSAFRHIHSIIITTGQRRSIAGKMLHACKDGKSISKVLSLEALYSRCRYEAAQIGIFTSALTDTAPAGVDRNVDHRGERPVQSRSGCLGSCHAGGSLDQFQVPAAAFRKRNRKYRLVSMNHIISEHQRDSKTRFFNRNSLKFTNIVRSICVEDISAPAISNISEIALMDGWSGHIPIACKQDHLTDLLVQCHLLQKFLYARVRILKNSLSATGREHGNRKH